MKKVFFTFFIFLSAATIIAPLYLWGQKKSTSWTTNPFSQKVFIENKGQFTCPNLTGDEKPEADTTKILFSTSIEGVDLYFTSQGLTYKYEELIPMTEEEIEKLSVGKDRLEKNEENEEEEKKMRKVMPHYFSIEWLGSNADAKIISAEPVSFYYTYGGSATTIKANAYKKIIYKNLYPNIDVEYIFPSDSNGIKYSLILHPGANPEIIKIKYKNAKNISLDPHGNIVIKSSFGNFIDHAPKTFYKNGTTIKSSFELSNNTISFKLNELESLNFTHKTIIIDPWLTNPNSHPSWTGFNSAYDINYDMKGNVYVYGSYNPYKLAKLNSAGVIQWIYNAIPGFGVYMGVYYYGDFAVDELSGTSYIVEGVNASTPVRVLKVNTLGSQTAICPGDANLGEMWRAEYNRCINKIVIAGGGPFFAYQAAMLDTNMINITPVNILAANEGLHDIPLLAIDKNTNFCYMATAKSQVSPALHDNMLVKCPIPALFPTVFSVSDGYNIGELNSVNYVNNNKTYLFRAANGMNGMAVSPNWLYTYDGNLLKKWDKNVGTFINAINPSALAATYTGGGFSTININWGGLTADECDNVYAGVVKSINKYNSSLTLVNSFTLPDTVYDLKLGPNNKLYACGKGFVTEMDMTQTAVAATQTAATCGCDGIATINSISCAGDPSGYTYSWNTSPVQTTAVATGLCPGNYEVTVTSDTANCSIGFIVTGTVTVLYGGALSITVTPTPVTCINGSAIINVNGGSSPYTYLWSEGQTTDTATGLAAGTYTITITENNGCFLTTNVTITQPAPLTPTTTVTNVLCNGSVGSASVAVTEINPPYSYLWSNGQTIPSVTNLIAGTYTVTITDGSNCVITITITVIEPPLLITTISATNALCNGGVGSATVNITGGVAPYTPAWSNNLAALTTTLTAGTYTVTITDINGCITSATVTITQAPALTATVSINNPLCNGGVGSATVSITGGIFPYKYNWSNGATISTSSNLTSQIYSVTITDDNGCALTQEVTITDPPPIVVTVTATATKITPGDSIQLSAVGNGNYVWIPASGLSCTTCAITVAKPEVTTSYCVELTDINGCTDTDCITIEVDILCGEVFIPTALSPNSDGQNDLECVFGNCIKSMDFIIFDRWGNKVFETNDPKACWNGTYKGKPMNTAIFVYYLHATFSNKQQISKKGNITLVK